jgi:hypothetical protein
MIGMTVPSGRIGSYIADRGIGGSGAAAMAAA